MTKPPRPCATCIETHHSPILFPVHVVHPLDGMRGLWDVRCETVCPRCLTRWRHERGNGRPQIVG